MQVVKAFVRERYEIDRFRRHNEDYMQENIKVGRLMAIALPVLTLLTNLGIVAVVWFGGRDVIGGRLTLGELVAFNSYLMIGMAPLMLLGNVLTMVSRAEASAGRFWEVLDTRPAVKVAAEPHRATALQGQVTFEGVSFHYDGSGTGHRDDATGRFPTTGVAEMSWTESRSTSSPDSGWLCWAPPVRARAPWST